MELLTAFPNLLPQNVAKTHYSGFMEIKGQHFYLDICSPTNTSLEGSTINCEWKLKDLLRDFQDLVQQRLKQCSKLVDFLKEFKRIIELQLDQAPSSVVPDVSMYGRLVAEIETIGWHRVVFIDSSFKQLHLVAEDVKQRRHILRVHLHDNHPRLPPRCVVDLPRAFDFAWTEKSQLADLVHHLDLYLEQYQDLWTDLDQLDDKTWILEPEKPTRADLSRRIALGNNASLQMTIDANHPRVYPECRFLGADRVINPLKAKLNANIHKWNVSVSVLENLQTVLELDFPSPTQTNKQDFSTECGICYAYRLGTEIPDQACDDARCGQPYHHSCLYEWLRSLPSFRQSFNIAFGECPYCNTPITVKTLR